MKKKSKGNAVGLAYPDGPSERDWRAQEDANTLKRAQEVMGDKARLTAAKKHAADERKSLERVERLKGKTL